MATPPTTLLPYLTTQGSLTALLEVKAGQPLCVKVIKEGWQTLDFQQKKSLGLPVHRPSVAWVREVELFGDDEAGDGKVGDDKGAKKGAWVRAKSIFPIESLTGNAKRLRHLHGTPIGYVMFKKHRTLPCTRRIFCQDGQWGRRSIYDWQGRVLLIEERFSHEFLAVLS